MDILPKNWNRNKKINKLLKHIQRYGNQSFVQLFIIMDKSKIKKNNLRIPTLIYRNFLKLLMAMKI